MLSNVTSKLGKAVANPIVDHHIQPPSTRLHLRDGRVVALAISSNELDNNDLGWMLRCDALGEVRSRRVASAGEYEIDGRCYPSLAGRMRVTL
jgi:hypothetical protein